MDDLIYRSQSLAEIDELSDERFMRGPDEPYFVALAEARDRIEELPGADRWISVKDRLPETDEVKYIVACKTKSGIRSINMAWFDGQFWHGMGSMAGVTHWMQPPEFPEEVEE